MASLLDSPLLSSPVAQRQENDPRTRMEVRRETGAMLPKNPQNIYQKKLACPTCQKKTC